MTWVLLLKALLQLAQVIFAQIQQRQLLDAGEARAVAKSLDASLNALGVMDAARSKAVADFDADNGVHNRPDKYRRD